MVASSRLRSWLAPHEHETARDRRRSAPLHFARAIVGGREPHQRLESRAERAEAREPDEKADLGDREVRRAEELARSLDPARGEVVARRLSVCVAERAYEVIARVAGLARDRAHIQRLRKGPVHQVLRIAQMRETLDV